MSLIAAGLGAEGGSAAFGSVTASIAHISVIPLGAVFGYLWPRLSWLWGLVLGWGILAVGAFLAINFVACQPPACSLRTVDIVVLGLPVALVLAFCVSAAVGAFLRRRAA
jgi:hypothetical protein